MDLDGLLLDLDETCRPLEKASEYDREIPQSHTACQPIALSGKSHSTITITSHQVDNNVKQPALSFPSN